MENNKFSKKLIRKILAGCPPLPSIPNGRVYYVGGTARNGEYPAGTRTHFICNNLYERSGPQNSDCQASGKWNRKQATCNDGDYLFF